MKLCAECGKNEIEDKYMFCLDCVNKQKEKDKKMQADSFKGIPHLIEAIEELDRSIGAVNNNLYAIRFMGEHQLNCEGKKLSWNKKKKCFEISEL